MHEALPQIKKEQNMDELQNKSAELYLELKGLEKKLKNEINNERTKILIEEKIAKLAVERMRIDIQIGKMQSDLREKVN
jgi:DNA replication initiation complex subunit (GINS family)